MSPPDERRRPRAGTAGDLDDDRISAEPTYPAPVPGLLPPAHGRPDWTVRRGAFAATLVGLGRAELIDAALTQFDRADVGLLHMLCERDDARLLAEKQASAAISAGWNWTEASRRPSYAELQRRRVDHPTPCRGNASCRCSACHRGTGDAA